MKDFIEKLIGRLEELTHDNPMITRNYILRKEAIKIINQLAEEYKGGFCEWKYTKSVSEGGYFYSCGCIHKRFSDLHDFEYCPYCGKKIKVVK